MGEAAKLFISVQADVSSVSSSMHVAEMALDNVKVSLERTGQAADGMRKTLDGATGGIIGDLKQVSGATAGYVDGADRMRDATSKFGAEAEHAKGALEGVGHAADQSAGGLNHGASSVSTMTVALGTLAGNLAASALMHIADAALDAGRASIQLAGELEQSKVAFTTMLGSAQRADAFLRDLANFAAHTPFELKGLQDSSKRLLAFGFDARDIIPIMTAVGNAVGGLGGGKDVIDGITLALGQMSAKGKVSAQEMNQLAERGVPAWKMVADAIGKDIPTAMKLAEKGAIDSTTAITALVNGMNAKFPGMMEAQSKTLLGAMSNLSDGVEQLMTKVGTRIIDGLRLADVASEAAIVVSNLGAMFDNLMDSTFNQTVIPTFAQAKEAVMGIFTPEVTAAAIGLGVAIATVVVPPLAVALVEACGSAAIALAGIVIAGAPVVALGAVIAAAAYPIVKNWDAIRLVFYDVFSSMETTMMGWYSSARNVAQKVMEAFGAAGNWIGNFWAKVFNTIGGFTSGVISTLPQAAQDIMAPVANALAGFRSTVISNYASLPGDLAAMVRPVGNAVSGLVTQAAANANSVSNSVGDSLAGIGTSMSNLWTSLTTQVSNDLMGLGKSAGLHLGKANKALDDHAKAHKAAADAAEKAAKRIDDTFGKLAADLSSIEIDLQLDPTMDALKYFEAQASVLKGSLKRLMQEGVDPLDARFQALKSALKGINEEIADVKEINVQIKALEDLDKTLGDYQTQMAQARLEAEAFGPSFDLASKSASIMEGTARKLAASLGPLDPLVKQLVTNAAALKNTLDQDKALENWGREMTIASEKAAVLGSSFNLVGAQSSITSKYLEDFAAHGIHSGLAFDALRASHEALHPAQVTTLSSMEAIKQSTSDVQASVSGLKDGLNTLGEAFGVNLGDSLLGGIAKLGGMGLALIQVSSAVGPLTNQAIALGSALGLVSGSAATGVQAAGALGAALGILLNPITLTTAGVAALVAAGVALINNWEGVKDFAARFFKGIAEQAGRAWQFVINSAHDALEHVRYFFSGGAYQMDLWVEKQHDMEAQADRATAALLKQGDEIVALGTKMKESVTSGFSSAMGSFLDGSKTMAEALRDSVKKAIIDGIVEAMMQKTVIMDAFGGLFDSLTAALHRGDNGAAAAIVGQIGAQVPRIAQQFTTLLQPLQTALGRAFGEPASDAIDKAITEAGDAMKKQDFATQVLGQSQEQDLAARIGIVQKALTDLHAAGADGTSQFAVYQQELASFTKQLQDLKATASSAGSSTGGGFHELTGDALRALDAAHAGMSVPALAAGGLATGATMAMIGEGAYKEAVLPLSPAVLGEIAAGIASYTPAPPPAYQGAGGNVTVQVNYTGKGRWTREDGEELGGMIVEHLGVLGIGGRA